MFHEAGTGIENAGARLEACSEGSVTISPFPSIPVHPPPLPSIFLWQREMTPPSTQRELQGPLRNERVTILCTVDGEIVKSRPEPSQESPLHGYKSRFLKSSHNKNEISFNKCFEGDVPVACFHMNTK